MSPSSEAEWWDYKYPVDPNFLWQTQVGDIVTLSEMSTWHVFNSLRMIWNHTVRLEYRIHPYKRYRDIYGYWTRDKIYYAVQNLYNELLNRNDRSKRMEDELNIMRDTLQRHGKKLLM